MDKESATEAVDSDLIPGRVKPKTTKIGIYSFLLDVQQLKGQCEISTVCGRQVAAWLEGQKVPSLFPHQGNLVNKM